MNRITYICFSCFILLSPLFVKGDVLLWEEFSSLNTPSGWSTNQLQGSTKWTFRDTPNLGSNSSGGYAVFDDQALGPGTTPNEAFLQAYSVDCSNRPNVYLTYSHFWLGVEFTHGYIEISTDNGTTFNQIFDYHKVTKGSLSTPQDTTLNISAWAANQSSVTVRFRYTDGSQAGQFWYLDDVSIHTGTDVEIIDLFPEYLECQQNFTTAESVTLRIYNHGITPISNIPISCLVSGGTTASFTDTYTGTIPPFSYVDHTFAGTIDMSLEDIYIFEAFSSLSTDEWIDNDTLFTERWSFISRASLPYFEDFNNNSGGWKIMPSQNPQLNNADFIYGYVPYLGGSQGNGKSFYTEVTGGTSNAVWLESPIFDLSEVTEPLLSMDLKFNIIGHPSWQFARVEYSTNSGNNWSVLGSRLDSNWYNSSSYWWFDTVSTWTNYSQHLCELSGEPCVKLRIAFHFLSATPANTQFAFDNVALSDGTGDDLQPMQFFPPQSGSCSGFTTNEPMGLTIRNNYCRPITNVPVQVDISGATTLSFLDSIDGPIPAFGYYHHTFTQNIDMSAAGTYSFQAELLDNITGDSMDYYLDTASNNILLETRINGPISTFPYFVDFNMHNDGWSSNATNPVHLMIRDTLRTMGGQEGFGHSWFLDDNRVNSGGLSSWVESPTFDLSNTTDPNLYMDIKKMLEGHPSWQYARLEYSINDGASWSILGSANDPNWYNSTNIGSYYWYGTKTNWHQVQYSLCDHKEACIKFRVKVGNLSSSNHEFAFDNFEIRDEVDAGIVEYLDPIDRGCLFSANQQVTVAVYNWSCSPIFNVPVQFEVTGTANTILNGVVPGPIPAGDTVHYTFPGTYDMTPLGYYYLSSQVVGYDNNADNDTLKSTINVTLPKIVNFPHVADFDSSDELWIDTSETATEQFHWGPVPYLGGPQGYGNSWYTDITSSNAQVWVESPVFDLSKISDPFFNIDLKFNMNGHPSWQNAKVDYSIDGGASWKILGSRHDSLWYNDQSYYWYGSLPNWTTMSKSLCDLSGEPCVKFRVIVNFLSASAGNNYFAFDNVHITGGTGDDLQPMQIFPAGSGNCSTGYSNTEYPGVTIRNNFCRPLTDVPFSIKMTGPNTQTILDTIPGPIPRFGYIYYQSDKPLDMSLHGEYSFELEVFSDTTGLGTSCINDTFPSNNILIENRYSTPINTYPYLANFEAHTDGWASAAIDSLHLIVRDTLPNMGGPEGEGLSWYLDDTGNSSGGRTAYVYSPMFDLTSMNNPQLNMDIKKQLGGHASWQNAMVQYSINDGNWTKLGDATKPNWYDFIYNSYSYTWNGIDTTWNKVQYSLCEFKTESCIKFRVRTTTLSATNDYFAFDNFEIKDIPDVGVTHYIEPVDIGCLFSPTQVVKVAVHNWTCSDMYNVPITSIVSGTANATFTGVVPGPIPPNDSIHYTLPGTFDMTPLGWYYFETTTNLSTDQNSFNDVHIDSVEVILPKIASYPYFTDFNLSDALWKPLNNGTNQAWIWDSIPFLSGAEGNDKSWYTVNNGSDPEIFLETPVFDFSTLNEPYLTFDTKFEVEGHPSWQYVRMDYSLNGGTSWTKLGTTSDPRWYETTWVGNYYWYGTKENWTQQSQSLCDFAGETCVKFRFSADFLSSSNGNFAIDNFHIREIEDVAPIAIVAPVQDNCLYSGADSVQIEVYNWSCHTVYDIPVTYKITGPTSSTSTEVVDSIEAESRVNFTFANTIDLLQLGTYQIQVFSDKSTEINRDNDTIYSEIIVEHLLINTFDSFEDFNVNSGFGNWAQRDTNAIHKYLWGQVPYLGGPDRRGNSMYLLPPVSNMSPIFLESPVYDFSNVVNPELFLELKYNLMGHGSWQYARIQYSINGGSNWTVLGSTSDPKWYNSSSQSYWWNGNVPDWTLYHHDLCHLIGESCVMFRVEVSTLSAGPNTQFAMDNWHITNTTIDLATDLIYSCSGSEYELELTVLNRGLPCIATPIINSFEVGYSVDGGTPIYHSYSGLSIPADSAVIVTIPNTLIPNTTSEVKVWVFEPNGLLDDQVFINDTIRATADQWPNCNDHCSNAQFLTIGSTTTSQTSNATIEPAEDPTFSNCGGITIENTVWYTFSTDAQGGWVTVDFENILCSPSDNGIQVSIDELSGPPCMSSSLSNIYCNSPTDTVPFGYGPVVLPANTTYYIIVDGFAGNSCDFDIVLDGAIFNPFPSGEASVDSHLLCFGDNNGIASVQSSNGILPYSYLWSDGQTSQTATGLSAGTYTVTVTESAGNSFTASVQITEPSIIDVSFTTTSVICLGVNDGSATVSATGGTPGYSYLWDSGQTGPTATGLAGGMHTVTVVDQNNCSIVETVQVEEPSGPGLFVFLNTDEVSCGGLTDGMATATPFFGTPPYSYQWDANANNQTTAIATGLGIGSYMLTVTDDNGCSAVDGILILEELCDPCKLAFHNNTDICAVLTADPSDPLSSLDCDGDGVLNGTECTDLTDPSDHCDFDDGSITEPVTADQSNCLNLCQDLTVVTRLIPNNIVGPSPIALQIDIVELNGVDTDPTPITVRMPSDPRLTFIWNIAANPNWNYTGNNGLFHEFIFVGNSGVLLGGTTETITIGLAEGMYDPQGTDGVTSISPSIVPFSGGECIIQNNSDPEALVYFW